MKTRQIFLALSAFLLLILSPAFAQKNIDTQHLIWTHYYLRLKFNDKYQLRQEWEERNYFSPWRQHQIVSRTMAERQLGKGWSAGVGFTYFIHSLPQVPEVSDYSNQQELRPQLEIIHRQSITEKFSIHHQYWSELRFFEQPDGSFKLTTHRTRYKLELRYSPFTALTLKAYDEIHVNIGRTIVQNVFDQNRYGASMQYMPRKNFGFELGYINWFQQRKSGIDFYNRHIVRLTIHQTLTVKTLKVKNHVRIA